MKLSDWIGFLALIIALLILWEFREILLLVFMAMVIAIALNSLVRWLQHRWRLKRGLAVMGALSLVALGGFIVAIGVFPPFGEQIEELVTVRLPEGMEAIRLFSQNVQDPTWIQRWSDRIPFLQTDQLEEAVRQVQLPDIGDVVNQVSNIIQGVFGNFLSFFSTSAAIALQVLLVVILTIMMLSDPSSYRSLLIRLFPSFYRRRADAILTKCERILLAWMRGVCLSSIFVAIACAAGLLILRVDLVFAHALLAGLFNIIPNIGPTLSLVFPVSVALIDSPGKAVGVVVLYLLVQNLESYWFSPMVMRQQVSLLPAATLVAQLFFALFLGPLGLVLALPLTVVSKVWIEEAFICDVLDRWERSPSRAKLAPSGNAQDLDLVESKQNAGQDNGQGSEDGQGSGAIAQSGSQTVSSPLIPSSEMEGASEPSPVRPVASPDSSDVPLIPDPTLSLPESLPNEPNELD